MTHRFALILVVVAIGIVYIPIYTAPFIWDDHVFIGQWEMIRDVSNIPHYFVGALPTEHIGDYRPLHGVFQTVSYALYGLRSSLYHIQAVVIHMMTTVTVFVVLKRLGRLFHETYSVTTALFGSLLFGLHPLAVEPVAFVTASFDTTGVLFAMLSYYFFLQSFVFQRIRWTLAGALFALVAFLFYELTYTLPVLFFVTYLLHTIGKNLSFVERVKTCLHIVPVGVVLCGILFFRFYILRLPLDATYIDPGPVLRFLAMMHAIYQYCLQSVVPGHLAAVHEIAPGITTLQVSSGAFQQLTLFSIEVATALILLGVSFAVAVKARKKHPLVTLGIVWYVIGLLPVLSIIAPGPVYSERYVYLSLVGFAILLCGLIYMIDVRATKNIRLLLSGCITVLLCLYGMRTWLRTIEWANPVLFWTKESQTLPGVGLIYKSLGNEYQFRGKTKEAIEAYTKGVTLMPEDAGLYYNISMLLFDMKRYSDSKRYAEKAVSLEPTFSEYTRHLYYLQQLKL